MVLDVSRRCQVSLNTSLSVVYLKILIKLFMSEFIKMMVEFAAKDLRWNAWHVIEIVAMVADSEF